MTDENRRQPLAGARVLDISEGIAGPFCAKLLGDLGADVVKVERPVTGDHSRALGPFPAWAQDPTTMRETSAAFFFLNTSKRSVVLDIASSDGREQLRRLVQQFDIVIAGETVEALDRKGIGYQIRCNGGILPRFSRRCPGSVRSVHIRTFSRRI